MASNFVTISADQLVAISLVFLAVVAVMACAAIMQVLPQLHNTLLAYTKLADTLDTELKPTLLEVKEVLQGVNQLRQITTQRVSEVGQKVTQVSHSVEDAAGSVTQVADTAKRQSSVWGAGLLAGIKVYLAGHKEQAAETRESKS